jgi:hypothetical protein
MIVKCVKCNIEKEISNEDIDKIKSIVEDGKISRSVDYLEIFNVTRGKCTEQKKHTFIFEESFFNNVQDLIKKRGDILSKRDNDEKELSNTNDEITELEDKLKNVKEKKEGLIENIKKEEIDIESTLQEFEQITGGREIDIWS